MVGEVGALGFGELGAVLLPALLFFFFFFFFFFFLAEVSVVDGSGVGILEVEVSMGEGRDCETSRSVSPAQRATAGQADGNNKQHTFSGAETGSATSVMLPLYYRSLLAVCT
jgi:hypothetical protein